MKQAENKPGEVSEAEGLVILEGQGGVSWTMTLEAAVKTGERLLRIGIELLASAEAAAGNAR